MSVYYLIKAMELDLSLFCKRLLLGQIKTEIPSERISKEKLQNYVPNNVAILIILVFQ